MVGAGQGNRVSVIEKSLLRFVKLELTDRARLSRSTSAYHLFSCRFSSSCPASGPWRCRISPGRSVRSATPTRDGQRARVGRGPVRRRRVGASGDQPARRRDGDAQHQLRGGPRERAKRVPHGVCVRHAQPDHDGRRGGGADRGGPRHGTVAGAPATYNDNGVNGGIPAPDAIVGGGYTRARCRCRTTPRRECTVALIDQRDWGGCVDIILNAAASAEPPSPPPRRSSRTRRRTACSRSIRSTPPPPTLRARWPRVSSRSPRRPRARR